MRYCAWSQPWLQPSNCNEFCHREVTQNLDIALPFQCSIISIIHSWIPYGFASRNCLCRPDPEGVIFDMSHFQRFQQEVVSDKRNQALFKCSYLPNWSLSCSLVFTQMTLLHMPREWWHFNGRWKTILFCFTISKDMWESLEGFQSGPGISKRLVTKNKRVYLQGYCHKNIPLKTQTRGKAWSNTLFCAFMLWFKVQKIYTRGQSLPLWKRGRPMEGCFTLSGFWLTIDLLQCLFQNCGKVMTSNRLQHLKTAHKIGPPLKCDHCNYVRIIIFVLPFPAYTQLSSGHPFERKFGGPQEKTQAKNYQFLIKIGLSETVPFLRKSIP